MLQLLDHFAVLPDPRAANARHKLSEIVCIALAATLAGAKKCVKMAEFGQPKQELLGQVQKGIAKLFVVVCDVRRVGTNSYLSSKQPRRLISTTSSLASMAVTEQTFGPIRASTASE